MRYDLAFFLCCCKSFLGSASSENGQDGFYEVLGIERDATPEEIKRAYKRQSLQMHPDKLAQRGQQVTEAAQAKFQRMKEAYEVLSDPHKRETYNAIGERGMKWIEEPFSLDPQEMARNFANSSTLDRSKIFAIFVCIGVIIFILPVLICMQVDGIFGSARWTSVLIPLWIWNAVILVYHIRIISLGPTSRPDNIPEGDWEDPLPMSKRFFSLFRFCLLFTFEIFVTGNLDGFINFTWFQVFIPIYIWEATTLYKKAPVARMRIVTFEDLETALGKPYSDFTAAEKDLIYRRYSVVPSLDSPEFETAHKLKSKAKQDIIKAIFRLVFLIILIFQLDTEADWNWWYIFAPFWIMSFCICCGSYQSFAEIQGSLAEIDPTLFTGDEENQNINEASYGAMDGKRNVSPERQEELKAQLVQSGYRMVTSCCTQAFVLLVVGLFVGKLQGGGYSSFWIISPLLIIATLILLCLGCTIFCITDVTGEDELETYDNEGDFKDQNGTVYAPPPVSIDSKAPKSTWDPEKGEIWVDTKSSQNGNLNQPTANEENAPVISIQEVPITSEENTSNSAPVDLLDITPSTSTDNLQSAIDELD